MSALLKVFIAAACILTQDGTAFEIVAIWNVSQINHKFVFWGKGLWEYIL